MQSGSRGQQAAAESAPVGVETTNAVVVIGPSYSMHGGNLIRLVAPTTVEEYRFLRTIGCVVREQGMPPFNLPK